MSTNETITSNSNTKILFQHKLNTLCVNTLSINVNHIVTGRILNQLNLYNGGIMCMQGVFVSLPLQNVGRFMGFSQLRSNALTDRHSIWN